MEVVQAQLKRAGIALATAVVDHATYHAQIRKNLGAKNRELDAWKRIQPEG